MDTRTIALDQKDLEAGIEALLSAAQALQLTRFERLSYRALMLSADVFIASSVAISVTMPMFIAFSGGATGRSTLSWAVAVFSLVFIVSILVGMVSLALNIPLFRKASRERARLKELGLDSLSQSLWKESRRSRWISRVHGALLIVMSIFYLLAGVMGLVLMVTGENILGIFIALFYASITTFLLGARYLRNQRERIDLTASAEELRKALEGLRQRAGKVGVVSVPSELLEQAARIEWAKIAKERKDAVLESVAFRPSGYAIAFDRDAAERRATLGVADRVELEDLVAQLSTEGAQPESQAGAVAGAESATFRGATKNRRVEIEYVIDQASHGIRIIAVRHGEDGSHSLVQGDIHA
jgi:hypothetical protein